MHIIDMRSNNYAPTSDTAIVTPSVYWRLLFRCRWRYSRHSLNELVLDTSLNSHKGEITTLLNYLDEEGIRSKVIHNYGRRSSGLTVFVTTLACLIGTLAN